MESVLPQNGTRFAAKWKSKAYVTVGYFANYAQIFCAFQNNFVPLHK